MIRLLLSTKPTNATIIIGLTSRELKDLKSGGIVNMIFSKERHGMEKDVELVLFLGATDRDLLNQARSAGLIPKEMDDNEALGKPRLVQ